MDNKKFLIIFISLILIIVGLVVYSVITTAKVNIDSKNNNISIDEFNNIILQSSNFKNSKVVDITEDDLYEIFNLEKESFSKFYGKKSALNTDASIYLIIEPKKDKSDEIYTKLEQFCKDYELKWSDYLEAEYDIVVDRKLGKISDFIYLIISDDSYDMLRNIK